MQTNRSPSDVDFDLLWGWVGARSIARGLPMPVLDHGGIRVDTSRPEERQRFVFHALTPAIGDLARAVTEPHVAIKLCGAGRQLLELIPPGWTLQPPAYLMIQPQRRDPLPVVPAGYRIDLVTDGAASSVQIIAEDGTVAASGHAAEYAGVFIVDRIATDAAHRRRGLGTALMAALGATQRLPGARRVLVATEEGRALYATLGWTVLSPYSTVMSPDPSLADGGGAALDAASR
jgi:GNAT superfamily N-acetyltransferase